MTVPIRSLGPVPEGLGENLDQFLTQMRLRVLKAQADQVAGIAGNAGGSGTPAPTPGPPGPPGAPPGPPAPDPTPPPTPGGVSVSAGLDFIFITTEAPTFTEGHGYDRTIVYGAQYGGSGPLPTFSSAVVVHEFRGQVGSFSREPATQWHIWLKWRTNDGFQSVSPQGGANGNQVTTGQNVANLLTALTGQVTQSQLFSTLSTRINLIDGSGSGSVNQRIADGDAVVASSVSSLSATVGTNSAAIATEQSVRAAADGFISAYYGLRTQVSVGGRTVVGGIGIMGSSGGSAGPTIDVGVIANKFWVAAPTGTTGVNDVLPFVIQTTDETINGVLIPKGVYMDAAYIKNLSAMTARLGNAWITNAMIANLAADKILAGSIAVGQYIQSSDFVTGVSGWRLSGNTAEIGSAAIRGLITAAQINANGLELRTTGGAIILSGAQNLDWARIQNQPGSIFNSNVTIAADGTLNGAGGGQATLSGMGAGPFATLLQLNIGNISTYIASAAIGSALIGSLNANVINAGSIRGRNMQAAAYMTKGTFLVGVPSANAATVTVDNTTDFASSGTFIVIDATNDRDIVTYTGKTATTFTGCATSGGNAILGSHADGATVVPLLKGMVIDDATNEMRFYGNRGDGVIEELSSIGISQISDDFYVGVFGSLSATTSRRGVRGQSGASNGTEGVSLSGKGVLGSSSTSVGVEGSSGSQRGVAGFSFGTVADSIGVQGVATEAGGGGVQGSTQRGTRPGVEGLTGAVDGSGPGVKGSGVTGYGGEFLGNATKTALFLAPSSSAPTNKSTGSIFVDTSGNLWVGNGSTFQKCSFSVDPPP